MINPSTSIKKKMGFDINGKIAIITGGGQGLGFRFAEELLKNGLKGVTIADIDVSAGQLAVKKINEHFGKDKALFVKTDVTDRNQFENAFIQTVNFFKNVDILINNAGILNDAIWEREIQININGVVNGMLLGIDNYLKKFKSSKEAVILNMCSTAGTMGSSFLPIYTISKFAVVGIVKCWGTQAHLERTGVRVVGLCPGPTDTALMKLDGKYLGPDYERLVEPFVTELQSPDYLAKEMVKVIQNATNGSLWVVENNEPPYEYQIPPRETYKACA